MDNTTISNVQIDEMCVAMLGLTQAMRTRENERARQATWEAMDEDAWRAAWDGVIAEVSGCFSVWTPRGSVTGTNCFSNRHGSGW